MAISYDDWKKQYEGMTTEQQKNYANMVKGNATATEYANRYIQEKQNAGSFGTQTANSYTNTNQSTNTSTSTNQNSNYAKGTAWYYMNNPMETINNNHDNSINQEWAEKYKEELIKNQQNQTFDSSKLTNPNAQVTVKQGTAAQTWLPDYQDTSDAREQEIINNLNAYWNNPANKSFFADRATFNSTFHYDERNDRQKAILDSFWKGTENYNKATSYTDWKSFSTALNSWNVTEAQYAGMKDWNPEVFKEWQDQLKEEMNLAISNLSKITTNYDNAEILQTMMEKLWIEPQQWRDIIGWWEEMMDRTWAWSAMKDATKARESYNAVADKMTSIMNRYSSSTWGTQSDALVAARLQKALAPYQQQAQNYYSAWQMANTEFQTKLGTANNYASTIQAQAAEDQRIFQQKLTSLGFAMQVNSYRTPEQQAALQLQTQQIQNNMALYQQSRLNELSLYNQKQLNDLNLQYQEDLTKLQNKLSYELKDLSVEDPEQLKANLNNILTDYFSKYWDIIQRSQSQVVEDVIAYAKEHWISVAQALKENFIEPLQNKQEYKNAIAKKYPADTTWQPSYDYSIDENWKLKVNVKGTWNLNLSDVQKQALLANLKTYSWAFSWDLSKNIWYRNNNPWNIKDTWFWNVLGTDSKWFAIFATPEDWFDALVAKLQNAINGNSTTYPATSTLYQFFEKYAPKKDNNDPKKYAESVANKLWISPNTQIKDIKDVTKFAAAIAQHDSWYKYSTYWQFRTDPTYWWVVWVNTNTSNITSNPYQSSLWTTSTWAEINSWWWITSLEKTFWNTQRMSDAERKELYESYGIDKQTYDKMEYNYAKYLEKTEWVKTLQQSLARAEELLKWNEENRWLHEWWADIETAEKWYYSFWPFQWISDAAEWKNKFDLLKNNEVLNKFLDLKKNNASFWQMSEWEWTLIWNATNELNRFTKDAAFETNLKNYIKTLKEQLANLDSAYSKTDEEIIADTYFTWAYNTWFNEALSWVTNFIIYW